MRAPYRLVVFDWEGTLGDTLGQILTTVASVARDMNIGEIDEEAARQYVALGLVNALQKLFPTLSLHQHEQLLEAVQHRMTTNPSGVQLIPGAKAFLEQLNAAGIDLAIATNKGQHSLQRALLATGLEGTFKVTRSAGQVPPKPYPQMLEEIMDACGATASETLMIGDSKADIEMANMLGVDAIGVDFYHQQGTILQTAGALAVFDDYQALANYLKV